ncbi:hypothetical protein [Hymenobacter armeniacus]|uniref:Lipoprotein n=1 Tax=Hymenobacter armeniacus TaxID=2771358 RepID=A0ABR8K0A7_9BACT|nr:hypothetical protein [Hymenobacter armeniacus]MBD2724397.1 hypothetical protein [Hymenobacter armeniacus]
MTASFLVRGALLLGLGLGLISCEDGVEVKFAAPFPAGGRDVAAFPTRRRAVYTAPDSVTSLCVGASAVWRQQLHRYTFGRKMLDSLPHRLRADSTYQDDTGQLHYLKVVGSDSIRDSWLGLDTLFALAGNRASRLRRFQGRYYLSTPTETAEAWDVQRLEIVGHRLIWQTISTDTLRLLALDTATVRHHRAKGISYYLLSPGPGYQASQISRYAGLWQTEGEFRRRR